MKCNVIVTGLLQLFFGFLAAGLAAMSLNRCEQRVFEYLQGHRDERQYWQEKVRAMAKVEADVHAAATRLEAELWRYYVERSGATAIFRDAVRSEGLQKTSMKNLAELILRLWVEPIPKKNPGMK